jgi:predicted nucleic acid-binding protein
MSRFVVDCSVTMAWCFEDAADAYAVTVLKALARATAVVPALWPYEVASVLLVAERHRRLRHADATRFLTLLSALPFEIDAALPVGSVSSLRTLAREHRLSAYDTAYLDLAIREGVPLATRDTALRNAARAAAVRLFT